jgi:hypothetical protein
MKKKINSKLKGKTGELEIANYLSSKGYKSRRSQQFCGSSSSADVLSELPYHIECKRCESLNVYKALEQAQADVKKENVFLDSDAERGASDDQEPKIPIVIHRRNRKPWLVILELDDFLKIHEKGEEKAKPQN